MRDKELRCIECGEKFTLTVNDQEWYAFRGFKEPRRCKNCRRLRRAKVVGEEDVSYGQKKESNR